MTIKSGGVSQSLGGNVKAPLLFFSLEKEEFGHPTPTPASQLQDVVTLGPRPRSGIFPGLLSSLWAVLDRAKEVSPEEVALCLLIHFSLLSPLAISCGFWCAAVS